MLHRATLIVLGCAFTTLVTVLCLAAEQSRTIAWKIEIDEPSGFDFSGLRIFVAHREDSAPLEWRGAARAWKALPVIAPDESGHFVTSIPMGHQVLVRIETNDGMVQRVNREGIDDYFWISHEIPVTVLREEFHLDGSMSGVMTKSLVLKRGGAFRLCLPPGMQEGSVQFRLLSTQAKGLNVISFGAPDSIDGAVVGGLEPGKWVVTLLGDDDEVKLAQVLDVRLGQLSQLECHQAQ